MSLSSHHIFSALLPPLKNTGYVEGDGGVMYSGASLTNGHGMQYRENFVHHSLEVSCDADAA